jgi:hypothetical protein
MAGRSPNATTTSKARRPAKAAAPKSARGQAGAARRKAAIKRAPASTLVEVSGAALGAAVARLAEVAEELQAAQVNLQDALFHMPRASEYEPLAEPLRAFARLAPSLVESLGAVPRLTALLDTSVRRIEQIAERLEPPTAPAPAAARAASVDLERVAEKVQHARRTILEALGSLPAEDDYVPVARQLREIASVSPSLLSWLDEVPKLTIPLSRSVTGLHGAAAALEEAWRQLVGALPDDRGTGSLQ